MKDSEKNKTYEEIKEETKNTTRKMIESNPLVKTIIQRFDLRLDSEVLKKQYDDQWT